MNERNVAALAVLLADYRVGMGGLDVHWPGFNNESAAEYLAARGVLVPSALTAHDWSEVLMTVNSFPEHEEDHEDAIAELEYIAKGEPLPPIAGGAEQGGGAANG